MRSKSADTERELALRGEPVLEALRDGELGGVEEKERRLECLRTPVEQVQGARKNDGSRSPRG
jgi:hypothetical protein